VHILVDAFAVRAGSAAVILEGLLAGWQSLPEGDRLTVAAAEPVPFQVPPGVAIQIERPPVGGALGGLWSRTVGVRRVARRVGADAVLSGVTASSLLSAHGARGVILTDLRHEVRPEQFSWSRRLVRRVSYAWSFRLADGVFCISERTRADLVRGHPWTAGRALATPLGADHVDRWPRPDGDRDSEKPYALAFGHFANKNADAVLAGWAVFCAEDSRWTLRMVGMGAADRAAAEMRARDLGIAHRVELMPWLDDVEFAACFAGAGLILFPSEFEGFGLPVVEGMRLGIPVVVSSDPALQEVAGGHAVVVDDVSPAALAAAARTALERTPDEREAARRHTDDYRWSQMAREIRDVLARRTGGR
jgi:glycosyltransferase involved in cell wall biosynthesis